MSDCERTIEDVCTRAQQGASSARSTPPLSHCCFGVETGCRTAVAFSTVRIGSGWPRPYGLQDILRLKTGACERLRLEAGDIVRGASLVVWAIKDGRDAATSIESYLQSKQKMKVA